MEEVNTRSVAGGAPIRSYPRSVVEQVKQLALRGDHYWDIAAAVKHDHKLARFNKNNVASMINRLRARGELPPTKRTGGKRKPAATTLARV